MLREKPSPLQKSRVPSASSLRGTFENLEIKGASSSTRKKIGIAEEEKSSEKRRRSRRIKKKSASKDGSSLRGNQEGKAR